MYKIFIIIDIDGDVQVMVVLVDGDMIWCYMTTSSINSYCYSVNCLEPLVPENKFFNNISNELKIKRACSQIVLIRRSLRNPLF